MRLELRLLVAAASLFVVSPVLGQYPRDNSANKKIDEALNVHYLATDFKKAEDVLLGTIGACETKCKPATIGRAWMYVGVVRGSGNKDQAGAKEAFEKALKADPAVTLDAALATPETRATFEALGGQTQAEAPDAAAAATAAPAEAAPAEAAAAPAATPAASAGLDCSPGARNVQTSRPIPVACRGDAETSAMSLRYKEFGGEEWVTVNMLKVDGYFQGEIPCDVTHTAGPLRYFVVATDAAGDPVDTFGSKGEPMTITLEADAGEDPPAFPGKAPPERCEAKEICPPDFPGCGSASAEAANRGDKEWGASCEESSECASGLLCIDGSCETAPSCVVDADCETGVCHAGKCDIKAKDGAVVETHHQNYVGLHFALDTGFVGGKDVCRYDNTEYECYVQGSSTEYPGALPEGVGSPGEPGDAYPGAGIGDGIAGGSMRVLASYDRAFSSHITGGLRAGFAFGGSPGKFFPFHGEARIAYWFMGLSAKPVRPYAHLSGGVAQVDLKSEVLASDCTPEADKSYEEFVDCTAARGNYDSANSPDLKSVTLDAYKHLGLAFAGAGVGALFMVSDSAGAQLNLNFMYMFPDAGLVIQPSLGVAYAF